VFSGRALDPESYMSGARALLLFAAPKASELRYWRRCRSECLCSRLTANVEAFAPP
jgi:hypothetical protein